MKYIIFLSLLIFSFSAQSEISCSRNGTRIIYTNGVLTERDEALEAMERVKKLTYNAKSINDFIDLNPQNVNYSLAYNFKESVALDFLEAAVQRFPNGFLRSLNVSNGYAAFMAFRNGRLLESAHAVAYNSIIDKLVEIQSDAIMNYKNSSIYLPTVNKIAAQYEKAFKKGERVFAISHSQGGLFMNDAFQATSFTNKHKFFSGFQIATPVNDIVMPHYGHTSHNKDRLINFVRTSIGALDANVTAPSSINNLNTLELDYLLNHGIVTTYLNDSTIKSQIIPRLINTAQLLESNCPKALIKYSINNLQVNFDSTDLEDPYAQNPNISEIQFPEVPALVYSWDFGDGQTLVTSSKNISHNYSAPGQYKVTLTVKNTKETEETKDIIFDSVSTNIIVNSVMRNTLVYYFANRDVMFGLEGPLVNSGLNLTYVWDFGDGNQAESSDFFIIHKYNNEGSYPVTLNVYDSKNNLLFIKTTVIVVDRIRATICADNTDILKRDFVATTILGFSNQIDLDPNILGRCYIKSNGYFSNANGQTCAYLFNCTKFSLIP